MRLYRSGKSTSAGPSPIPWGRVIGLMRPIRKGLAGMVALSIGGVLVGLVPPLALGVLVNALVERNDKHEAAILATVIAAAIIIEATAYVLSDGLYGRNAAHLYRNLRLQMFTGARRIPREGAAEMTGLPSRFISDAETLERVTVSILDSGAMLLVEFVSAFVALGLLAPWTIPVVIPALAATWIVTRKTQQPAATAGQHRQEELEHMTESIVRELGKPDDAEATAGFKVAAERVMAAQIRVGWLRALNLQGSAGLAKLGPIAVVVVAAFASTPHVGTLISLYLLAQRTYWGFDGIVDLSLATQSVRGGVSRCFTLIDTPATPTATDPARRLGTAA